MQLVEPGNDERWNGMRSFEINGEWRDVEEAERERKKMEPQLQAQALRTAKLDRAPQIKLGPAASAIERKERRRAALEGVGYQPATERGQMVQEAQEQHSLVEDARERFDAARTAYCEARELGFSRTCSVYEAAREALLFGVEPSVEETEIQRSPSLAEREPVRGLARMQARQQERERDRKREEQRALKRPPSLEESIWDSLDKIGREQSSPSDREERSDAMDRIQQRTTEQQQEREHEAVKVKRERQEREKLEQERDHGIGLGYGM